MIRASFLALALCCFANPGFGQTDKLPDQFFGRWLIDSVEGDDPFGFETERRSQLIGRQVDVTPDRITLWNLWSGSPGTVSSRVMRLDQMASYPNPSPEEQRIGRMSYRFWFVNMTGCSYHEKPVASCVPIILTQEEATGRVGLYTNTLGMAFLQPVHQPGLVGEGRH